MVKKLLDNIEKDYENYAGSTYRYFNEAYEYNPMIKQKYPFNDPPGTLKNIQFSFSIYDEEFITLVDFIHSLDINNTDKEQEMYDEILRKDLNRSIRPEFKEALLQVKKYVDENHLRREMYFDINFQLRLLLMFCLYMVCGAELESCVHFAFNKVFYGIREVEITPRRVNEEYKYEHNIKLTVPDYHDGLFDLLFKPLPPEARGVTRK